MIVLSRKPLEVAMSRSTSGLIAGLLFLFLAVPAAAQPCGEGDAVFTELMISPLNTSLEWIEVKILAEGGCSLDGCLLYDESEDEPLPADLADWPASEVVLAGSYDEETYVLLAKNQDEVTAGLAAVSYDSSLYLSADEELHLVCGSEIVDSIDWDWDVFKDRCTQPTVSEHGCSVNLPADLEDVSAPGGDDFGSWCLPPEDVLLTDVHEANPQDFSGTPGAHGECRSFDWPEQAIITEHMVASTSALPDWFEIEAPAGADLRDCTIERWGALAGPDGFEIDEVEFEKQVWITWEGGEYLVPGEGVMMLTRGKCLDGSPVLQDQQGCPANEALGLPPSYVYLSVDFVANRPQWVGLYCPGDGPDRALIDGTFMDQDQPGGEVGRSWCFDPALGDDNTQPDPWLPALDDAWYIDDPETGEPSYGTPGVAGSCLPEGPPPPVRGEILFTEVIVAPSGLPEWIEVANIGPAAWSLAGCTLGHVKVNDEGVPLSSVSQFLLGAGGGIPELEPQERWVLSQDLCHDGTDPEVADCPLDNESQYSGFTMANEGRHELWIECPGSEDAVEEMTADPAAANSGYEVRNTHSMIFESGDVDCGDLASEDCNDEPALWCEACFEEMYATSGGGDENYGTPGEPGACDGDDDDDDDDDDTGGGCNDDDDTGGGCDCLTAMGGRPPSAAIAWLVGATLVLLRRRRASPGD